MVGTLSVAEKTVIAPFATSIFPPALTRVTEDVVDCLEKVRTGPVCNSRTLGEGHSTRYPALPGGSGPDDVVRGDPSSSDVRNPTS